MQSLARPEAQLPSIKTYVTESRSRKALKLKFAGGIAA